LKIVIPILAAASLFIAARRSNRRYVEQNPHMYLGLG
jgi:hypothetical protein